MKKNLGIKDLAEENNFLNLNILAPSCTKKRRLVQPTSKKFWVCGLSSLKPLKIVINSGNGAAGPTLDAQQSLLKWVLKQILPFCITIQTHPFLTVFPTLC